MVSRIRRCGRKTEIMNLTNNLTYVAVLCAALVTTSGCRTGSQNGEHFATKYRATDGRTVEIGPRMPADGGWSFKEPHMNKCWIASGFDFRGYDTLLLMPTLSAVQVQTPEEGYDLEGAKKSLAYELGWFFRARDIVTNVVTRPEEVPPGAHVLKLETTIIEFKRGSFAARDWAGLFGAGQPVLRVSGTMTDGDKPAFTFEARRSGVSAGAHILQMPDEAIQRQDIRSMVLDISDFAAAIAGKYQPKN